MHSYGSSSKWTVLKKFFILIVQGKSNGLVHSYSKRYLKSLNFLSGECDTSLITLSLFKVNSAIDLEEHKYQIFLALYEQILSLKVT